MVRWLEVTFKKKQEDKQRKAKLMELGQSTLYRSPEGQPYYPNSYSHVQLTCLSLNR